MRQTLYHYPHCPFCIRVRMAAGFLGILYETKILDYDDEKTPTQLCGRKMLPIWVNKNGNAINESLDIIALIDESNKLKTKQILGQNDWKNFEEKLSQLSGPAHSLSMPYVIYTKEFSESSRVYFQRKKEEKRGPFSALIKNRNVFEKDLKPLLASVEKDLKDFYKSDCLGLYDILLASHLWSLYIVPEFQFSEKMHGYLQKVKELCHFDYYSGIWS